MDNMSMATSTGMADMTMTGTVMPSATSGMGMGSGSDGMTMTSESMAMVFFSSLTTPLFSSSWTPFDTGSYAGTCIFLVVLAVVHRALLAAKCIIFDVREAQQRAIKLEDEDVDDLDEKAKAVRRFKKAWESRPFRVATETSRAGFEVVTGGIGYLL